MNLNDKLNRLENTLYGVGSNPLLTGAYTFHSVVTIGGPNNGAREWVQNNATGHRYDVTPEWRKMIDEYNDNMIRAGTPVEFGFQIGPDEISTNDTITQNQNPQP